MTKLHRAFVVLIAAMLLLFICAGATVNAYAETSESFEITEQETEDFPPVEDETETIDSVASRFINYLKDKYGADYEFYYNSIIEQWGSVEGYLLAFGNKLPEQYQTGWDKFVCWLRDYAPIWAVPLAILIVVVVALVGRKVFNNAVERVVNAKLKPVTNELNLQSKAMSSLIHGQKALLGGVPKFEENVKELDEAAKELTDG